MGLGPFRVRRGGRQAIIGGYPDAWVVGVIREMWGRDEYLNQGYLRIPENATVLDLGANIGSSTLLALTMAPAARVLAVEPNTNLNEVFQQNLVRNGLHDQVQLCRAFMGDATTVQNELLRKPEYQQAPYLTGKDLIQRYSLTRIHMLKYDIEGSEYSLLRDKALLSITDQIAVELHSWAGSPQELKALLSSCGFDYREIRNTKTTMVLCGRRKVPLV